MALPPSSSDRQRVSLHAEKGATAARLGDDSFFSTSDSANTALLDSHRMASHGTRSRGNYSPRCMWHLCRVGLSSSCEGSASLSLSLSRERSGSTLGQSTTRKRLLHSRTPLDAAKVRSGQVRASNRERGRGACKGRATDLMGPRGAGLRSGRERTRTRRWMCLCCLPPAMQHNTTHPIKQALWHCDFDAYHL